MEKRRPSYPLTLLKAAFADPATLNLTATAMLGARALGMGNAEIVAMIQALASTDFDKSMTCWADHRVWQDVYRPAWRGKRLYVKFTKDEIGRLLLISLKEQSE